MAHKIVTALRSMVSMSIAMSDEEAMTRVRDRDDPAAFARLMARWEKPIRRLCLRMMRDGHRAEDLTQEIFARLFARRHQYEASGRFSTYLWRMALNRCHDERRRAQRFEEVPLDEDGDTPTPTPGIGWGGGDAVGPDTRVAERERGDLVRAAVERLSESHRVVVVLRHYEGLKFREIADILEIPVGTVKSRMAEALDQLGRLLARQTGPSGGLNPKELIAL